LSQSYHSPWTLSYQIWEPSRSWFSLRRFSDSTGWCADHWTDFVPFKAAPRNNQSRGSLGFTWILILSHFSAGVLPFLDRASWLMKPPHQCVSKKSIALSTSQHFWNLTCWISQASHLPVFASIQNICLACVLKFVRAILYAWRSNRRWSQPVRWLWVAYLGLDQGRHLAVPQSCYSGLIIRNSRAATQAHHRHRFFPGGCFPWFDGYPSTGPHLWRGLPSSRKRRNSNQAQKCQLSRSKLFLTILALAPCSWDVRYMRRASLASWSCMACRSGSTWRCQSSYGRVSGANREISTLSSGYARGLT